MMVNGLARPYPHALELGQVRPRTRLQIRLGLPALGLGQGLGRGDEFACVGTTVPCFTAYGAKSRIAACSNHLKNLHGFCRQGFSQLLLSPDKYNT